MAEENFVFCLSSGDNNIDRQYLHENVLVVL